LVSSLSDAVATFHRIHLPPAVKYGPVRVGAYGREAVRGYHDAAGMFYETAGGSAYGRGVLLRSPARTPCLQARPRCWAGVARCAGA
jgi:hypothetical protein